MFCQEKETIRLWENMLFTFYSKNIDPERNVKRKFKKEWETFLLIFSSKRIGLQDTRIKRSQTLDLKSSKIYRTNFVLP